MAIKTANDKSMSAITALPSGVKAQSLILLSTTTASDDSTIDITSGIDSTYKEYIFKFINIHPATDDGQLWVKGRDGGSSFDATATTTFFIAHQREDDGGAGMQYQTGSDLAQGTSGFRISEGIGNANDENGSGYLHLFNPSSTTFVKHFYSRLSRQYPGNDSMVDDYMAGYFNVTAAIDGLQFYMNSGNIDAGIIKMYGVL